jgi:hypothetical protein
VKISWLTSFPKKFGKRVLRQVMTVATFRNEWKTLIEVKTYVGTRPFHSKDNDRGSGS